MQDSSLDDRMDRLVAEYSDRVAAGGSGTGDDLLAQVPAEQREALARCFRMIRAGLAQVPSATRPLGPGMSLGGFEILEEIGRGGMAVVYRARQVELDRLVALKVLRPGLALEGRHVDRFRREALAIARLQHPHIVQVFAVGEDEGYHWLAMELVDGVHLGRALESLPDGREWSARDLAEAAGVPRLAEGASSYEEAFAALMAPVARAIGVAHELGIVHRDVKPSNILIHRDGRAMIADFGLAKGAGDPGLSLTGQPLGTPFYMSPEQAAVSEHRVDERTDVYSLGVTLYEGLTGQRPFGGESVYQVLDAIRHQEPAPVRSLARSRSRDAQSVVERAMARDPDQRYSTALELAGDLAALAERRPTLARATRAGWFGRLRRGLRRLASGRPLDYRSRRTLWGLPLVHVCLGSRRTLGRRGVARGWIAVGDVALGGVAFGGVSVGVFSFGGLAAGLLVLGGLALGLAPTGGMAVGGLAQGGFAVGHTAVGGGAVGIYAFGGGVTGRYAVDGQGRRDPEAMEWGEKLEPFCPLLGTVLDAARRRSEPRSNGEDP